jgi:hypothetical protein
MTVNTRELDVLRAKLATAREIGDRVAVVLLEQRLLAALRRAIAERAT